MRTTERMIRRRLVRRVDSVTMAFNSGVALHGYELATLRGPRL
jgi:hypothetical protein